MRHPFKIRTALGLKRNIFLKRTVILSLIGFTVIFSAGITLIFKTSINRDAEHIRLVSLAGEVEREVLNARIFLDDIILKNDDSLLEDFGRSIDTVRKGMEELHQVLEAGSLEISDQDTALVRENYADMIRQLNRMDARLHASPDISEIDTILYDALNQFILHYRELQSFLPVYLIRDNIKYKREIILVLVANFLIILGAGIFIVKLIHQLIRADRALVIKAIDVENRERERIAADLHDGLGSLLSGLIIHIRVLEKQNKEHPELLDQLNHLNYMANEALKSIEEVIHNLNPAALARYGLIKSIEKYAEKVNILGKTRFTVHAENFNYQLMPSTESLLYRICSELINNALKHSSAEKASFRFYNQKKNIYLEYQDDGVGFDQENMAFEDEKSGLSNLIRRVDSLEGSYRLETKPGKGVRINIMFKAT